MGTETTNYDLNLSSRPGDITVEFTEGPKRITLRGKARELLINTEAETSDWSTYRSLSPVIILNTYTTLKAEIEKDFSITEEYFLNKELLKQVARDYLLETEKVKRGDRNPLWDQPKMWSAVVEELYKNAPSDIKDDAKEYVRDLILNSDVKVVYDITFEEPEEDHFDRCECDSMEDDDY